VLLKYIKGIKNILLYNFPSYSLTIIIFFLSFFVFLPHSNIFTNSYIEIKSEPKYYNNYFLEVILITINYYFLFFFLIPIILSISKSFSFYYIKFTSLSSS
jgi:hypothetical protein